MKSFAALAVLILATTTAHAMSVMTNATGPYNYTCDDFAKAKRRSAHSRWRSRRGTSLLSI